MKPRIYLDYAATTPLDERVLAAMQPYFSEIFGNPSSAHFYGQDADAAVEEARSKVAGLLGCSSAEIVFTANGTESDNLALRGVALAMRRLKNANHILISPVEHHAVSHTAMQLAEVFGFDLSYLPVDAHGQVSPQAVKEAIRPNTAVVAAIYANNEIGTINPVADIHQVCQEHSVPFLTDAVQAAAHLPMNQAAAHADLIAIGAHKFYGPKGVGALYVRQGTPILPTQTGGKQEHAMRAGTQNVPYIVGLAEAFSIAQSEGPRHAQRLLALREHLINQVLETIPGAHLTGHAVQRLPNHASFVFEGVNGNTLLMLLDAAGFACSSGSACKTGNPQPSEVLLAMGFAPELALGSLRITLGRATTSEQIEMLLTALPSLVKRARQLNRA
ncbi:MAG TPA: cysteine desulfurase family protein [Anaerolineaceae bacterium]|nr:cysteine desulfurase family protein [Anaerolineaceae bacterium]HPN52932.1 cysteine desulfurase family protein [Anaerolineaceae bacterium]